MFESKFARHPLLILIFLSTFGGECQEYLEERDRREPQASDIQLFERLRDDVNKLKQSKEILGERIPKLTSTLVPGDKGCPHLTPSNLSNFMFFEDGVPPPEERITNSLYHAVAPRERFLEDIQAAQLSRRFDELIQSYDGYKYGDANHVFNSEERYVVVIHTKYTPAKVIKDKPEDILGHFHQYEPGSMQGTAFLFDPNRLDFVCAARFDVLLESRSDNQSYSPNRTFSVREAEQKLDEELREQVRQQIKSALQIAVPPPPPAATPTRPAKAAPPQKKLK